MRIASLFFICVVTLMSSVLNAQTKREILEEDPKRSPNLRFEISPLDFKTAEPYYFGGASFKVAYRANNKFTIVGEFRKEYFDMEEDDFEGLALGSTIGNEKAYAGFGAEVTATYYFASKDKEADEWMPVKSRSVGYRTIEVTIDPVATTKLNLYGVRGGYAMDKSTNTIYSADISEVENPANVQTGVTVMPLEKRSFFFGGLSYTRMKNVKVRYPAYGIRRKQILREIYADVLIGTDPAPEHVVQSDGAGNYTTYRIDKYGNESKTGWRVGVFSTPTGRLINCGYGLEIASMPGVGEIGINVRLVFSLFKKVGLTGE